MAAKIASELPASSLETGVTLSSDSRFRSLKQGDHACVIYDHPDDHVEAMINYVSAGLRRGERCIYIVADRTEQEICRRLTAVGVAVGAALDSGRLLLNTSHDQYLRDGVFDPDRVIEFFRISEQTALSDGCQGLRVSGEMAWALRPEIGRQRLAEYEVRLNEYLPGSHSLGLCQYDRSRFSPSVMHDVLRAHPVAIIEQTACLNPYYEPPHLARGNATIADRANWMIGNLLESRRQEIEAQCAIRERDDFLSVAAQRLGAPMHALNLAVHALARSSVQNDTAHRNIVRAQRQVERLNRLIAMVLDASHIRGNRLEWSFDTLNLLQLARVSAAYFENETQQLGYSIQVRGVPVWGVWDAVRIGQVLHNLLSYAIKLGAGRSIEITIAAQESWAQLAVSCPGIGLDAKQKSYVFERFSSVAATRYRGGLDPELWIARNLVGAMHGAIDVHRETAQGSGFMVRLPLVTAARAGVEN
jgi:signal transduction histidine kinase